MKFSVVKTPGSLVTTGGSCSCSCGCVCVCALVVAGDWGSSRASGQIDAAIVAGANAIIRPIET